MRLLVNYQLISLPIRPKCILLEESCYERSQIRDHYFRNFTVLSFFVDNNKQRPKMDLEKCYHCSVSIEISLYLKVCFSLVTQKINN